MTPSSSSSSSAVDVQQLNFDYGGPPILSNVDLQVGHGQRCLLVGANGAGKSTLLRILAGKRKIPGHVNVLGKNAFLDAPPGVTYLGTEWAGNPIVKSDLSVEYLLMSMGSKRWPERTEKLLKVLDVDIKWHMHQRSDGQRRRVQLVMGLLQPWDVLLLDEVTVDLDVLVRAEFLDYLRQETEERNATIIYATHIFDGLAQWPTHIAHMSAGEMLSVEEIKTCKELQDVRKYHRDNDIDDSPLMALCYKWLREDKARSKADNAIDPATGQPHTRWDDLSEDMKQHGDKYYNYWK
ncbi:P-loop containing nucleoside triphosphate hydrolase protein [Syncephalastrum racemosum]|uniref:P-loop containing nucleoside triphosphate hydrolase protein n=1 Tax=Syncephalastrum racemosum TaxID=13706 RepID=A0A1X2H6S1_SYNRA|nr:P-loop containing nucleoside triphosphate hydrolase protein [Syncephalastrum racemosum]